MRAVAHLNYRKVEGTTSVRKGTSGGRKGQVKAARRGREGKKGAAERGLPPASASLFGRASVSFWPLRLKNPNLVLVCARKTSTTATCRIFGSGTLTARGVAN